MATLTEQEIINYAYALYEGDDTGWEPSSTEYKTARKLANIAINEWEKYDNTEWQELHTSLALAASDIVKETVADTYTYTCPTDFLRPCSWVRIGGSLYKVYKPSKLGTLSDSYEHFCYFTGSPKAGYTLNINPNLTISGGASIEYEYYKTATRFTAITDTTEMSDPYMIAFYIVYRLIKNDGDDYNEERDTYLSKLEDMATVNLSGYAGIADYVDETPETQGGFGI